MVKRRRVSTGLAVLVLAGTTGCGQILGIETIVSDVEAGADSAADVTLGGDSGSDAVPVTDTTVEGGTDAGQDSTADGPPDDSPVVEEDSAPPPDTGSDTSDAPAEGSTQCGQAMPAGDAGGLCTNNPCASSCTGNICGFTPTGTGCCACLPGTGCTVSSRQQVAPPDPYGYGCSAVNPGSIQCVGTADRFCKLAGFKTGVPVNFTLAPDTLDVLCIGYPMVSTGGVPPASLSGCVDNSFACQQASRRYCQQTGNYTGLGVTQHNSTTMNDTVDCETSSLAAVEVLAGSADLAGCTASPPQGIACYQASDSFCVSLGYAGGFGPIDMSGNSSCQYIVLCVPH